MTQTIVEFYFDFTCPYAYLASTCIESIADSGGATLCWRPMLLGGVFRAIGSGESPMERHVPAKAAHIDLDMMRYAERFDVPLHKPAGHPIRSVRALRALLSLPGQMWPSIVHHMYRAYWQLGEDISTELVVARVLERAGVAPADIAHAIAANDDPDIKAALRRRTDEAVARGVFGAPTVFITVPEGDIPYMFWGQDRLHLVRAVLAGWRPEREPPTTAQLGAPLRSLPSADGPRPRLHFFYDFSSPYAYLGATQIASVAASAGAELIWRPMLLGALFRDIGTAGIPILTMSDPKRAYMFRDMSDWASYWDVPFQFATHFPQRSVTALRLALQAGERIAELSQALFRVAWVEDGDLDDRPTLERVLADSGFDAATMLAGTQDPAVKRQLFDNTAEARARGVFGAPTCIVERDPEDRERDVLFWGQDRLALVADAVRAAAGADA